MYSLLPATGLNNVCACARGQHNKIKFRRERDVWFFRVQLNDDKKGAEILPLFWHLNANISFLCFGKWQFEQFEVFVPKEMPRNTRKLVVNGVNISSFVFNRRDSASFRLTVVCFVWEKNDVLGTLTATREFGKVSPDVSITILVCFVIKMAPFFSES